MLKGNPKALLEAMACGLPCIANDIDGIREIIVNHQNGLLMNCMNCKELGSLQLKQGILTLRADKPLAEQLGQKARETIEKEFALEKVIEKEIVILKDLEAN